MEFSDAKFIVIESCNFVDRPAGGQLNFVRLLLSLYRDSIATIGNAESAEEPIGCWFKKTADGFTRDHFNLAFRKSTKQRYWIPGRLKTFLAYHRYHHRIHKHPCKHFFVQEHAILMAFDRSVVESICYRFPGVESQLSKSRFKWAIPLARLFDYFFYRSTRKADILLASADDEAIQEMLVKDFGFLKGRRILQFPTRVDTSIFRKKEKPKRNGRIQFVSCGRLHWVKGWRLILDSLAVLKDEFDFSYIYIGDGPDREAFLAHAKVLGLAQRVVLAGFMDPPEIAQRLRSSDLYLMGSYMEGWPTNLVEAYVTGLPMVSTAVSGARVIIQDGVNGTICSSRDANQFARCIKQALSLDPDAILRQVRSEKYSTMNLRMDLESVWQCLNLKSEAERCCSI